MRLESTAPDATVMEDTRVPSRGPELVARYSAAKSRQDVEGALALCHEDFVLDAVPFGIRGAGKEVVSAQLHMFFATFPDYGVTTDGVAEGDGVVASWGTVRATMRGAFGSFAPTGRTFALPFSCVFVHRDGRLASERFFFDLASMCDEIGLPVEKVAAELRAFGVAGEGAESSAPATDAGGSSGASSTSGSRRSGSPSSSARRSA